MAIGLFSRCMGGVSTFAAMTRFPAAFDGVRCLVSPQPVTPRYIVERRLALLSLGDRLDDFDTLIRLRTSVGLGQRIPQEWAKNVRVPTFPYQVRRDSATDVQAMYDNIPVADKKLQWIEGTTARFDGYLEFQRRPRLCSTGSRSTCRDLARSAVARVNDPGHRLEAQGTGQDPGYGHARTSDAMP